MELRLKQVMREVLVVPETKPVLDLLHEFQERRRHLAIVVDEFGSTVGLVTVEDAIEQLVGEVEDEFDVAAKHGAWRQQAAELMLDGSVNLRDLETQMRWSLPREGGVETLAGFLLARLGKIPAGGETVEYEGRRLTVSEMSGSRISKVRIEKVGTGGRDRRYGGCEMRLLRALLFRLVYTLPVLWLVVSVVFLLIHLVPGDPIEQMLGEGARPAGHCPRCATRMGWTCRWAAISPLLARRSAWRSGTSLRLNDSVTHLVLTRYPYTMELTAAALALALLLAIPGGDSGGAAPRTRAGSDPGRGEPAGPFVPGFALGPILILLVSIKLGWLPVSGRRRYLRT